MQKLKCLAAPGLSSKADSQDLKIFEMLTAKFQKIFTPISGKLEARYSKDKLTLTLTSINNTKSPHVISVQMSLEAGKLVGFAECNLYVGSDENTQYNFNVEKDYSIKNSQAFF